ncbi:hypothetical protein B0H63DRAFT_506886 [Podospora didyma]|uniref:DUF7923 domain-containing protein n=1 Tax=Podospora didyma TaxID=330526 RepID=A0AAE0NXI5_9PEZI|nr:hypothetical protein B0H63DRAFT_506886 [Podospora didyma]
MWGFDDQLRLLTSNYRDVCHDLERERVAGRDAQEKAEVLKQKLDAPGESVNRNAFVIVLVDADADAYLFDDKYYHSEDPADGGALAVVDLRAAVRQYVQSIDVRLAGLPITAKAFASGEDLAHLLANSGTA